MQTKIYRLYKALAQHGANNWVSLPELAREAGCTPHYALICFAQHAQRASLEIAIGARAWRGQQLRTRYVRYSEPDKLHVLLLELI